MGNVEKVSVRYCGGCNPRYDRVTTGTKLKEEIEKMDIEGEGITLVICGCTAACVYKRKDKENPLVFKITSEEDAQAVLKRLLESR